MGVYDCFDGKGEHNAQLKCFECEMRIYKPLDQVPVFKFGYPKNCTFADWGENPESPFETTDVLGGKSILGVFVIVKDGQLWDVNRNVHDIIYPVFDKYGEMLADKNGKILNEEE